MGASFSTAAGRLGVAALLGTAALAPASAADVTLLGPNNSLVTVDSAAPGTIRRQFAITGVNPALTLVGIDARPASSRVLYALNAGGQLYAINALTGVASAVGTPIALSGTAFGFDFNPSVDRIRLITNSAQNLRLNPDNGAIAGVDGPIAYAAGDPGFGTAPSAVGAAYTNNVPGGTPTTLYVIDTARGVLTTQGSVNSAPVSPNTGQLFTVGSLGVASNSAAGFDISSSGEVVASLTNVLTGVTSLYRVNLSTGAATLIGAVAGNTTFRGLSFSPTPFVDVATSGNQAAVATVLDRFTGVPTAALAGLFTAIDGLPAGERGAALDQLTPGAYSLLPEIAFQTSEFIDVSVRRYLRDVRGGGTGTDVATMETGTDRQIGFWLVGNGRYGAFDARADRARVDYGSTGVIGGVDARFGETSLVGVMGGYDATDMQLGRFSADSHINSWFAGGYGSLGIGPFYVDAHGSYAKSDYDLRRSPTFGSFNATNFADIDSEQWTATATAGLSFEFAGFEVEPYGGARYIHLDIDDIVEGGSLTALTVVGDNKIESIQSIAGLRVGAAVEVLGATLRPSIRGEWRHEFENRDPRILTASLAGANISSPFQYVTTPVDNDYAAVGAGFTVSGGGPLSIVVDYNGQYARDFEIHGVTGGLRFTF